jgi:hypothetical protein
VGQPKLQIFCVDIGSPGCPKVETPIHDNDLIMTPIIASQSG